MPIKVRCINNKSIKTGGISFTVGKIYEVHIHKEDLHWYTQNDRNSEVYINSNQAIDQQWFDRHFELVGDDAVDRDPNKAFDRAMKIL